MKSSFRDRELSGVAVYHQAEPDAVFKNFRKLRHLTLRGVFFASNPFYENLILFICDSAALKHMKIELPESFGALEEINLLC